MIDCLLFLTWVTRNLVSRSGSRLFSLDKIISSISPWSFSMTTNTRSGVSNMHSRFTMPGWCRFWRTKKCESFKILSYNKGNGKVAIMNVHVHRTLQNLKQTTVCFVFFTCKMATSFRSWLSCLVGKRILSMTLMATSRFVFLCFPLNEKQHKRRASDINKAHFKQNSLVVKSVCLHQRSILFVSEYTH